MPHMFLALDLSLCLGMERCTADMAHILVSKIFGKFPCDITGAIVAEQARFMQHLGFITA